MTPTRISDFLNLEFSEGSHLEGFNKTPEYRSFINLIKSEYLTLFGAFGFYQMYDIRRLFQVFGLGSSIDNNLSDSFLCTFHRSIIAQLVNFDSIQEPINNAHFKKAFERVFNSIPATDAQFSYMCAFIKKLMFRFDEYTFREFFSNGK